MRSLNPKQRRQHFPYTETNVNPAGQIRITNIGGNGAVAQNLVLDGDEFDAAVADLIRRGAGSGTKIVGAMRSRGFLDVALTYDPPPLGTSAALEAASAKSEEYQAKIDELERQLADIREGQARTTADAEADEDEETYFERLAVSLSQNPDAVALLDEALERHGVAKTVCNCKPGAEPESEDPGAAACAGLATIPPESIQVDLTALADGSGQVAIRIHSDKPEVETMLDRFIDFCKDRGIPIKRRKQRAAPTKSGSGQARSEEAPE